MKAVGIDQYFYGLQGSEDTMPVAAVTKNSA